jgi:hypothetical protein
MGAPGHRIATRLFVVGLAFFAVSACSGAATSTLDEPAMGSGQQSGDGIMMTPSTDATSGSSSGGGQDATVADDAPGDNGVDASDSGGNDVSAPPDDAGPGDAGPCPACGLGTKCCAKPGNLIFGQCYSAACVFCC